jgi:hypothetical protein
MLRMKNDVVELIEVSYYPNNLLSCTVLSSISYERRWWKNPFVKIYGLVLDFGNIMSVTLCIIVRNTFTYILQVFIAYMYMLVVLLVINCRIFTYTLTYFFVLSFFPRTKDSALFLPLASGLTSFLVRVETINNVLHSHNRK